LQAWQLQLFDNERESLVACNSNSDSEIVERDLSIGIGSDRFKCLFWLNYTKAERKSLESNVSLRFIFFLCFQMRHAAHLCYNIHPDKLNLEWQEAAHIP
jgi:hypothetical protein